MKTKTTNKYSPEVRERAVRLVQEHRGEYPSLWATIESIAPKIGCSSATLNEWVKRTEVDSGLRDGVSTTLLPRHWAWLATQSGGASVVLRKLVEQALRSNQESDRLRQAQEAA